MKDLKLGMSILATTTLMLDNEILKLHPTTLVDAYNTTHAKELQIKLGKGHWGCCPTRNRSQVCIKDSEVRKYANNRLAELLEKEKEYKPKQKLYYVKLNGNHSLTISMFSLSRTVESLAEGSFTEYRGGYTTIKFGSRLPMDCYYSLEDAIKGFVNKSKIVLK